MGRKPKPAKTLDTELEDLPETMRWRTWMGRAEAVIFSSPTPATRAMIAWVVGRNCNIEALVDDIRAELLGRPYELVAVAGGWQHRTKKSFAETIQVATGVADPTAKLSPLGSQVLVAIAYFQPITRKELSAIFAKEIGRDVIADLRAIKLVASGPRSPQAGAPYTYVTTPAFLSIFGFDTLQDLPDKDIVEDAGMLNKESLLSGELHDALGLGQEESMDDEIADR